MEWREPRGLLIGGNSSPPGNSSSSSSSLGSRSSWLITYRCPVYSGSVNISDVVVVVDLLSVAVAAAVDVVAALA